VHHPRLEAIVHERAVQLAAAIEPARVFALYVGHRHGKLAAGTVHEQMVVREHQTKGVDLEPASAHFLGDKRQEHAEIPLAFEHRPFREAAVGEVMPTPGGVVAESSCLAYFCFLPALADIQSRLARLGSGWRDDLQQTNVELAR